MISERRGEREMIENVKFHIRQENHWVNFCIICVMMPVRKEDLMSEYT